MNDALDLWYNLFNDVVDKHLPKKFKRVRAASNPWLNNDIKNRMSIRDYLYRKALRSNDGHDWDEIKLHRNEVTSMVRKLKKSIVNKVYSNVTVSRKSCGKHSTIYYHLKNHPHLPQ